MWFTNLKMLFWNRDSLYWLVYWSPLLFPFLLKYLCYMKIVIKVIQKGGLTRVNIIFLLTPRYHCSLCKLRFCAQRKYVWFYLGWQSKVREIEDLWWVGQNENIAEGHGIFQEKETNWLWLQLKACGVRVVSSCVST